MTSNPESTRQLTSLLRDAIHVLDQWKVPHTLQPVLLGLGDNLKPREYNRYRLGTALSSNARVYRMAKKILHIDDATQKLFPFSLESARIWVTVGQPMLGGKSSLDIILEQGAAGLDQIMLMIDNQYDPYSPPPPAARETRKLN
ncbi:MAG: hypothetical protein P8Z78_05490 [Gammaproteobacteria bacterium]